MTAVAAVSPVAAPTPARERVALPELIQREQKRLRRRRWAWALAVVLVGAAAGAAWWWARPRPVPLAARFRAQPVVHGELVRDVRATGHVAAVSTVTVGAEISGRVAKVEVDYDDRVKAGQVLARFDRDALEAQRAQASAMALSARAQVAQARFDFAQARRNKARSDDLYARQVLSAAESESATTAFELAQARLGAAEAGLAAQEASATISRTNLDHAIVRAPIDGVIISRNIDPGQTVASMLQTPVLFVVAADLRQMEVEAAVDEADISTVRPGQSATFTVTAWPERTFTGTVTEVRNAAKVVQDVVTYAAVIAVANDDLSLKPGMTASVRIRTGVAPDADQVPNPALHFTPPGETRAATPSVWVLEGATLVRHPVTPGLSDGERTAIAPGALPLDAGVLVDLTAEGKKAYGLAPGR